MSFLTKMYAACRGHRLHSALASMMISAALLMVFAISLQAANMMPDPMMDSFIPGTATIAEGIYNYGQWRFYSVGGSNGTLTAKSPGRDGTGVSVELSKAVAGVGMDSGIDIDFNRILLEAGHRYRFTVWARSSNYALMSLACPMFDAATGYDNMVDARGHFATTPSWAVYTIDFMATSGSLYVNPSVSVVLTGNVEIDDITLQDITTITGEMIADSGLDSIPAGTVAEDGVFAWGIWRYFNVAGAGGKFTSLSPGRDGSGTAVKIERTTNWGTGDTGFDNWNSMISLQAGHKYRLKFWGRSDDSNWMQLAPVTFDASNITLEGFWKNYQMSPKWAVYTHEIAPTVDGKLDLGFRPIFAGSLLIDDISIEDVVSTSDLAPDPQMDSFSGASVASEGGFSFGTWRYFSVGGANGVMSAVTPGFDGTGVAVGLTRTAAPAGSDQGIDIYDGKIHLLANHNYRAVAWARSDTATQFGILCPQYDASNNWLTAYDSRAYFTPLTTWAPYVHEFPAPDFDTYLNLGFSIPGTGSVIGDNLTLIDLTTAVQGFLPDSGMNTFAGISTTDEGTYHYGAWRYYSVGGALGTLAGVVPGRDGTGTAVKLTQGAPIGTGSTGLDMDSYRIKVQAGHKYRLQVWARTDTGTNFWLPCPQFSTPHEYIYADARQQFAPTETWAPYSITFTAQDGYLYASPSLTIVSPGSVMFDDLTLEEVSTITGNVTSSLSLQPVPGALVTVTAGGSTYTATTDPSGNYSVDVLRATSYVQSVSADGYDTYTVAGNPVEGTAERNISLMPNATQPWIVSDTFTRANGDSLGSTEDANAIPWTRFTSNAASGISDNMLVMRNDNAISLVDNTAGLNRALPADIDLSIKMTWQNFTDSLYARIVYRGAYWVNCPWEGDRIELHHGTTLMASTPVSTNWVGVTVRVKVSGNHHQIYLDGNLVIDITDNVYLGSGNAFLIADSWNVVQWDNLNIGSGYAPPMGSVSSAKSSELGKVVGITGCVVTGAYDGFFYIEDTNRSSGIKVVSSEPVVVNHYVDVIGTVHTENDEKYISASSVDPKPDMFEMTPLGMTNKSAKTNEANGLLVKVWGNVGAKSSGYLYLDDGSGLVDATGNTGIRVDLSGLTVDPDGSIQVTGTVGMTAVNDNAVLVIRPRTDQDIQ